MYAKERYAARMAFSRFVICDARIVGIEAKRRLTPDVFTSGSASLFPMMGSLRLHGGHGRNENECVALGHVVRFKFRRTASPRGREGRFS
jgi:hypothetical protein